MRRAAGAPRRCPDCKRELRVVVDAFDEQHLYCAECDQVHRYHGKAMTVVVPETIACVPDAVLPIVLLRGGEVPPAEVGICTTCQSEFEHARRRGRRCTLCPDCRKKPRAKVIKMSDVQPRSGFRRCVTCDAEYVQPKVTGRPTKRCPECRRPSRAKVAA